MIDGLKPYPEYKDSGIPWLARVPADWTVSRIKTVLREVDSRTSDGSGVLLSLSRLRGLIPHSDMTDKMHGAKTLVGYKRYRPGQIVMNRMQAWSGMFGAGSIEGLVSPDYAVFEMLRGYQVEFVLERLKAYDLVGQFALGSKGIGSGFNRLYTDRFGPIPISLPPASEQGAIVRFLNHANRRIDQLIRTKKKVIALLNEQTGAIIHQAVTRGLDLNVPTRSSGVLWLGDIPQHWAVMRTKFLVHIKTGGRDTVDRVDGGSYPFFVRSQKVERIDTHSFDGEAVLTAGDGAGVAKVFHYVNGKFDYHQRVYKFSNFRRVSGQFFFFYLKVMLRFEALDASAKSTVDSLRLPLLQNFPTVVPPIEEQLAIVRSIAAETRRLETAILRVVHEIELLREYRTRLATDVVTGKLDVREAAAKLPDEADAGSANDQAALVELEEEAGDEEMEALSEEIDA